MAESFLEGQLKRIRAWTERMTQVQSYADRCRHEFVPHLSNNPLCSVRDYRMLSSMRDESADRPERTTR